MRANIFANQKNIFLSSAVYLLHPETAWHIAGTLNYFLLFPNEWDTMLNKVRLAIIELNVSVNIFIDP